VSEVNDLVRAFCRIEDPEQMARFFDEIFTPSERRDLALRWRLMQMLRDGWTQRKIAAALHVSLCKITRGAKILKDPHSVTVRMLAEEASAQGAGRRKPLPDEGGDRNEKSRE